MNKSIKIIFSAILIAVISIGFLYVKILAQESTTTTDIQTQYKNIKDEIERLKKQLNSLQNQEKTLGNQIAQFNSQIEVTTLQILEMRQEVAELEIDIDLLQSQIDGLEITLEKISSVLVARTVETYQRGEINPLKLLVVSNGFDEFLTQYAYISYMQDYDKKVLLQIQSNQNNISDKKKELVDKKTLVEKKKKQLESLKSTLDGQKKAKETLLTVTRNDETRYKKLLEAAQSKEEALSQLIFRDGKVSYKMAIYGLTKSGSVVKGARIGTMGNSGAPRCTTAAHLHMEVIENGILTSDQIAGDLINPYSHLKSRELSFFQDNNSIGSQTFGAGSWDWPLSNPIITQGFGKTIWSSRYLSGFHTGIDIVDYNDRAVKAPESGTLYYAKVACGNAINIAIIDYGGGTLSDFLHLE